MRHVVSANVPSIKTTGELFDGLPCGLVGVLLIYLYTVTEKVELANMPRRISNKAPKRYVTALGCGAKRRFKNEKEARQAADTQELQDMQLTLFVYHCEFGDHWHLTRQSTKNQ